MTDRIGPCLVRLSPLKFCTEDLNGTEVSDAIIPYIEKAPTLSTVELSGTRVTPSAVGKLKRKT